MLKINYHSLRQFWQIAKPYWSHPEKKAKALLLLLILLSIVSSILLAWETIQRGEIISALADKDSGRFWHTIRTLWVIIIFSVPLISYKSYIEASIGLHWRKWLTDRFLGNYLLQRHFYTIKLYSDIDNPDRSIAEDINNFTQNSLFLFTLVIDSIVQIIAFVGIIWLIYKPMILFLIVYSILGTALLFFVFGKVLTAINLEQIEKEASLRFGLIRVKDYAESIAFYQGEKTESKQIKRKLMFAITNFNRLIKWQFGLNIFQNSFQFITMLIPGIILAPSIFAGTIEVGAITQSQTAFERIWLSFSIIIFQFNKLINLAASIQRLTSLNNYLNDRENLQSERNKEIKIKSSSQIYLQSLSLITPDNSTKLIEKLSLTIYPKDRILITGNSGVGKSSLVRAIARLWRSGTGIIGRPESSDILFLPQSPYLTIGTLADQLTYPNVEQVDSDKLWLIIEKVNLTEVINKAGGLAVEKNWSQILSTGEQQRLAFARLFLYHPKYAILDESTSALDTYNQDLLYQELQKTNITYLSVGHRQSLLQYHQKVLYFDRHKNWSLFPADDFKFGC